MEVENVLAQHPEVAEACVFGIADRRWGEIVAAAVVPADPSTILDIEAIRAFARERLAAFKVPVMWEQAEGLPRNTTGKLLRRELIARHAQPCPADPDDSEAVEPSDR
jgi:acyl-CoA synthetase (AMP-forming)/AMP-acid ligase II